MSSFFVCARILILKILDVRPKLVIQNLANLDLKLNIMVSSIRNTIQYSVSVLPKSYLTVSKCKNINIFSRKIYSLLHINGVKNRQYLAILPDIARDIDLQ